MERFAHLSSQRASWISIALGLAGITIAGLAQAGCPGADPSSRPNMQGHLFSALYVPTAATSGALRQSSFKLHHLALAWTNGAYTGPDHHPGDRRGGPIGNAFQWRFQDRRIPGQRNTWESAQIFLAHFDPPPIARLPARIDALIGRETELAALADLLAKHRAVTVLGPGGTGKTQCALEAARRASNGFPDGVWFFDLVPFADADEALRVVRSAIATSSASAQIAIAAG